MIVDKTIHVAHVGKFGNQGPWLHFNLGDACPPGHDLPAILSEPKDRTARLNAWEAAVRTWDKGLLWQRRAREAAMNGNPIIGASMEAEKIVPVPHDVRMVAEEVDTIAAYARALRRAMSVISDVIGVPVVPYGATQILPVHTRYTMSEHDLQVCFWYKWHRPGGPLRGITPCQSFYVRSDPDHMGVYSWVHAALDRHAAVGHGTKTKPLTVFVSPELQGHEKAGAADGALWMTTAYLSTVIHSIEDHPLKCRVVSWCKASTAGRAAEAMSIVTEAAKATFCTVSA